MTPPKLRVRFQNNHIVFCNHVDTRPSHLNFKVSSSIPLKQLPVFGDHIDHENISENNTAKLSAKRNVDKRDVKSVKSNSTFVLNQPSNSGVTT